jgi:PhzF family phenazine biosynthesis protein
MKRRFQQIDVFSDTPLAGNPLAVVVDGAGLTDAQMVAFARWTNLSETTFLLPPQDPQADYRVRFFTPGGELPFAGHPTLGSCHAWLASGGVPRGELIVQECGIGLVRLRRDASRLAFAAPPLRRSGPVEPDVLDHIARSLRIGVGTIGASNWVDNGPGWVAVMLASRDELLALTPDFALMAGLKVGVVAPWPASEPAAQFEVRAFVPSLGVPEDPVTGSLNAGLAQWLIGAGLAPAHYVASQGTALGRAGRVHVDQVASDIWIGGHSVTCVDGTLAL